MRYIPTHGGQFCYQVKQNCNSFLARNDYKETSLYVTNPISLKLDKVKGGSGSNAQIHFVKKLYAKTEEGYLLPIVVTHDMKYVPALHKATRKLGFFSEDNEEFTLIEDQASILGS